MNDLTIETMNEIITSAAITSDECGLSAWLHLDYGNHKSQAFGGWALYLPKSFTHHKLESVAGHFIFRCMEIAGVEKWSNVVGKTIRVRATFGKIHAIGHIVEDDWFDPTADFKAVRGYETKNEKS